MSGMLYTSYFAKCSFGKGMKISVARFNPKWLRETDIDGTLINLSPPIELLNDYKTGVIDWNEYTVRYNKYILNGLRNRSSKIYDDFRTLCLMLNTECDVTIYCYEAPNDNCHRHLLAEIVKRYGYKTEELII